MGGKSGIDTELRVLEGVADLDLALHVMDDHVHVGHGPGLGDVFLAEELQRGGGILAPFVGRWGTFLSPISGSSGVGKPPLLFLRGGLEFYEEADGSAVWVVDRHAGLGWGDEFAGALAAALGEFADNRPDRWLGSSGTSGRI